jgi:hypothetical protein
MKNQIEVEVNGNKVTLTLTDEQIKQLQTSKKKEWYDDRKFDEIYMLVSSDEGYVQYYDAEYKLQMEVEKLLPQYSFDSEEQAYMAADYINLFIEMYNFCQLRNGENKIDWNNRDILKYTLELNYASLTFCVSKWSIVVNGIFGLAFIKKEHAEEAIEIFGDRIKAVYLKLQNY